MINKTKQTATNNCKMITLQYIFRLYNELECKTVEITQGKGLIFKITNNTQNL